MSGQLILTWYAVESSQHNYTDIDEEIPSDDEDFNHLMDHTDKDTVTISLNRLREVLTLLAGAEKSGNPYLQIGFARAALDRIIAIADSEEDLFHDTQ